MLDFPISGVETYWWLPMAVAFIISLFTSPAGLSGAFVLLPFQVSGLGYTAPGVTPTNLLFNIVAIPAGVFRFYREKRMVWPLVWTIAVGTVPGLLLGVIIRVRYLPDPRMFKLFVGLVLLYIAGRLVFDIKKRQRAASPAASGNIPRFEVTPLVYTVRRIEYEFNGETFGVSTIFIFLLSAVVDPRAVSGGGIRSAGVHDFGSSTMRHVYQLNGGCGFLCPAGASVFIEHGTGSPRLDAGNHVRYRRYRGHIRRSANSAIPSCPIDQRDSGGDHAFYRRQVHHRIFLIADIRIAPVCSSIYHKKQAGHTGPACIA
jgi:hypothetical protein